MKSSEVLNEKKIVGEPPRFADREIMRRVSGTDVDGK